MKKPLQMMKNVFISSEKLFLFKRFYSKVFVVTFFGHVEKRLDKKKLISKFVMS